MEERHEWQSGVVIRLRGRAAGRPTRLCTCQNLDRYHLLFVTRLKEIEMERFAVFNSVVEPWRVYSIKWYVNHYRIIVLRTRAFVGVVDGISALQGRFRRYSFRCETRNIVVVSLGLLQNMTAFNLYPPRQGCQTTELGSGLGAFRFVFRAGYAP